MTETNTLPALTGRPEIVTLANADRDNKLARLDGQVRATAGNAPEELVNELADIYRQVALRQTDASWWLGNQFEMFARIVRRLFTDEDNARLAAIAARR